MHPTHPNAAALSPLFPLPPRDAALPASPLSPHELLVLLWRHRWLIGTCVVAVSALTVLLLQVQRPVYSSIAKVWVQTEQQGTPSFLSGIAAYRESQYAESVTRKIETEMELLQTRSSADNVVERLGLTREQFSRSALTAWTADLAERVRRLTGRTAKPADPTAAASLGELFLETVSVQPLRSKTAETSSNVLELKVESTDAALAQRSLAALLDNYLSAGSQQTQKLGDATSKLLQTRLTEARAELRRVDDELMALALRENGRPEAAPTPVAPLPPERAALSGAGTAAPLRPQPDGGGGLRLGLDLALDASRGGNAQAVSQLKSQTLELQAQLDALRQVYTDDADNVRGLRRRIEASRQRLSSSVRAGVKAEAEFGRLERARALAQDRFVELQKKLDQIELYLQLNPAAVDSRVVIDAPSAGQRVKGKSKMLLAGLGPVGGLLLGLLLAGLRELFNTRLRSAAEVERALGVPALAAIPNLTDAERRRWLGAAVPVEATR